MAMQDWDLPEGTTAEDPGAPAAKTVPIVPWDTPAGSHDAPPPPKTTPPPAPGWGDTLSTYGGLAGRALLQANPLDLPANLHNLGLALGAKYLGADAYDPSMNWTGPGTGLANSLGLPQPANRTQATFSGAVGLPAGVAMTGGIPLTSGLYGAALRAIPSAVVGAGTGAAYDLPPDLQLAIGLGGGVLAGEFMPGARTAASASVQELRNAAREGGIDIPTVQVGPGGARAVYSGTGVPGSGMSGSLANSYRQWVDKVATDMGASKSDNGLLSSRVFAQAEKNFGDLYNQVRTNAPDVPSASGSSLAGDFANIRADVARGTPMPRIENAMNDLINAGAKNGGAIPGDVAVSSIQGGGVIDKILRSADGPEKQLAMDLKAAVERNTRAVMPTDLANTWDQADTLYKNYATTKDATDGTTGQITHQSLTNANNAAVNNGYFRVGEGTPALNAKIGSTFGLEPPVEKATVSPGLGLKGAFQAHGGGIAAGAVAAAEAARTLHDFGITPTTGGAVAGGLAALYPATVGINRLARAVSGGPNPPGALNYYAHVLGNPWLYAQPQQQLNQPPSGG